MKIKIDRDEAINICLRNTYCKENRGEILHCFLGFIGADWDLIETCLFTCFNKK